jgi:hypothetical protein
MPGPLTPRHKGTVYGDDDTPQDKPRDSAPVGAAGLQYVTDDPGLAVHPRRVLHGPAAPDWRGEIRVEHELLMIDR